MSPGLAAGLGFLLGSIPCSWLLVRWRTGKDLAAEGSGNVGAVNARNVTRSQGMGLVALVLDLLKGLGAVTLTRALGGERVAELTAGVAAVAGHAYNPWLTWRRGRLSGGKGFATAAGVFLALGPWLVAVWLAVLLTVWLLLRGLKGIRDEAPASTAATLAVLPASALLYGAQTTWALVVLVLLMLVKLLPEALRTLRAG